MENKATEPPMSRRRLVLQAAGLAALGGVAGSVLTEVTSSPALAATTVSSGATAPTVVALTDAATISIDASAGNDFRVTLGATRTMAAPSNPTDGQQITLQITQGASGSSAITWNSVYAFSAGLPKPSLSSGSGETDLLEFTYNGTLQQWLLTNFVQGFAASAPSPSPTPTGSPSPSPSPTSSPAPPLPSTAYRLFPSTDGPSVVTSWTSSFQAAVAFSVTSGGMWFDGYWWWVAPTGQSTSPVQFALWQMYGATAGVLVPESVVVSGTLTAGQWNYIPLPSPLPLTVGVPYVAANAYTGNFLNTNNAFGSGDTYAAGITNGLLLGYSDQTGSAPAPYGIRQGLFGTDPDSSTSLPHQAYESANFWMDVQVDTAAPAGASYRLWPNYLVIPGSNSVDTGQQSMGTEFLLSQSCTLDAIWFYSPPGVTVLPSQCAIWNVSTRTVVAGTDNTSPSWSGAAGSGWVKCSYSGVTLPAGDYKTTVYSGGGQQFYLETVDYFSAGQGGKGIVAGPLTCPNTASATAPGNSTYQDGPWSFPDTFDQNDNGETRWVDVEVTPVTTTQSSNVVLAVPALQTALASSAKISSKKRVTSVAKPTPTAAPKG
jgi:hypothetical protein